MRLFLSPPEKHVAIIIDQNQLTCAWLEQPHARAPFIIKAFTRKELATPNSPDCLFDPTDIGTSISHFIKNLMPAHSANFTRISCAFTPSLIYERLAKLSQATPSPVEFYTHQTTHKNHAPNSANHAPRTHESSRANPPANPANTAWDYQYLYPTDTHEYVFYLCGIAQPLLLQYKLLAITHKLDLGITTSQTAALLQLYRYMQGAAFRSSKLGIDMQRAHNNPELLFSDEMIKRIITIPAHNSLIDKKTALTLAGLMCTGI
jgi:hypothetical protein